MFKKSLIILIFIFLNISYLETNAVCTRDNFSDNDSYSKYLSWEWTCNGEYIYSDIAEQSNDLGEEYSKVGKIETEINTQEQNLEVQEQILNQIENATRWEWEYKDLSPELRQEVIDSLYQSYKENWWDANWWVWWDNLTEAREDLAQQKEDLAQQKEDLGIEADRLWKDAEQLSDNIDVWNEDINNAQNSISHNEQAIADIKSEATLAWSEADEAQQDADLAQQEYESAQQEYESAQQDADLAQQEYESAQQEYESAVNEWWYTVEELDQLKQKAEAAKTWAESEEKDADLAQQGYESAQQKYETAQQDAEAAKEAEKRLNDRLAKAEEANDVCKNDPKNCKKVYSDQQIVAAKEKIAKAKVDSAIEKVNQECSKWDTIACREAITEMNKAETSKACIDPNSKACSDAKEVTDISNDVANDYKKKAAEEAAQKEVEVATKKVDTECSKWDTLACREAIADMNKAEVAKACIDEWSTACSEAKEVASMTEAMVEETKANIAANPWLKSLGSSETMDALLWITDNNVVASTAWSSETWWFSVLSGLTVWFKDSLTGLVQILAVWAFLFVWIRLAMARWNPEEFKKALMHMIYVILWIFIITIAWAAVVLVAWINI